MTNKTKKYVILATVILGLFYAALFSFASRGYGYMGYYGYHRGPSFWYWGGPSTYYDRNNRSGSISGPSTRGGGPASGK